MANRVTAQQLRERGCGDLSERLAALWNVAEGIPTEHLVSAARHADPARRLRALAFHADIDSRTPCEEPA